jgi:hypothetical protein
MPASVISSLFVMSGEKTGSITAVMVSAKVRAFQDSRIISGKPQDLSPTNAAPLGFGSKDCFRAVVGMLAHPGSGAPPPLAPKLSASALRFSLESLPDLSFWCLNV